MRLPDRLSFATHSLRGYGQRTWLIMAAMAFGVAAVIILTALGEGARRYVVNQFSSLGTHLLIVFPGRAETSGGFPGALSGETPRDLTLEDALSLGHSLLVGQIAPLNVGAATVSFRQKSRDGVVLGTTNAFLDIRHMTLGQGQRFSAVDTRRASAEVLIGSTIRRELFGAEPVIGQWLRIGDRRFRVVGVLGSQGQSLGFNTDELVMVPVASAQQLFNTPSLLRILVEARSRDRIEQARADVIARLAARHEGEKDVTVVTQDALLSTFDRILTALTLAVGGIAAISLAVAGILIMNVMLIAVSQRTREIGLLKALGGEARQIRQLFFTEALLLSAGGAVLGLLIGLLGSMAIRWLYPTLPAYSPLWAIISGTGLAVATGILFALLPARKAAALHPVDALGRR